MERGFGGEGAFGGVGGVAGGGDGRGWGPSRREGGLLGGFCSALAEWQAAGRGCGAFKRSGVWRAFRGALAEW